jgi:hypothetical protein
VLRLITSDVEPKVSRVDVLDRSGSTLLALHRPGRLLKPRITVTDGNGQPIGSIVPQQVFTRLCCTLVSAGGGEENVDAVVGTLEGSSAADPNMRVAGAGGDVVARVSRTWEVLAPTHHPAPGTYIVQVLRPWSDPLRSLALAALLSLEALVVPDTVPKRAS